jgi:hypothetical protein
MGFIDTFTDDFVEEWNGRNLNVNGANINFDGRYGTQCMDLWNYWWLELELTGIPRHVDAAGVWEDFKGKHYDYFDGIFPNRPAKKGDIFIYNRKAWGTGYGHIGVVLSDNGDTITVLETNGLGDGFEDDYMNQYGSPPRIHTWPKTNLYGYLRYIDQTIAPQGEVKKEWDEMASREDIKAAVREVLNEEFDIIDPTGETKNVTGKSTLIKKGRWEAYLWAKNEEKLNQILDKVTPKSE